MSEFHFHAQDGQVFACDRHARWCSMSRLNKRYKKKVIALRHRDDVVSGKPLALQPEDFINDDIIIRGKLFLKKIDEDYFNEMVQHIRDHE